ncbi:MAG: GNAT family N-acetyltransferase [Gammaproteobacteria bacterium]|nr:GNAT family N-acetyltransferase [Gammaproteobacteria bacterium]
MRHNSPPDSVHALEPGDLKSPDITLFCVWENVELLGCGALKHIDDVHGEIKSMITNPQHLRKGVASAMLVHIIEEARSRGYRKLSLETGCGNYFVAAQNLYSKHGFRYCGPFATYADDGFAVFMTRNLV